jgi:hypothetical protein
MIKKQNVSQQTEVIQNHLHPNVQLDKVTLCRGSIRSSNLAVVWPTTIQVAIAVSEW